MEILLGNKDLEANVQEAVIVLFDVCVCVYVCVYVCMNVYICMETEENHEQSYLRWPMFWPKFKLSIYQILSCLLSPTFSNVINTFRDILHRDICC